MKIYTKTGDSGMTGLRGGRRVAKHDPRVAAYGEVDELNAALGLAAAHLPTASTLRKPLERVQRELFHLGAVLASENDHADVRNFPGGLADWLEKDIDRMEKRLKPLTRFILPGGGPAGAALHLARAVCRRAERHVSTLPPEDSPKGVLVYLNRLSDWLFVAARGANRAARRRENEWRGIA